MMWRLYHFLTRLDSMLWLWLLALAGIAIWGIGSLVHGVNYTLLTIVSLGGMVLGWLLTRIRAPWWLSLLAILGVGFQVTLMVVGYLWSLLLNFGGVILFYLLVLWWWGLKAWPGLEPLLTAWNDLTQGSGVVLVRLWNWLISPDKVGLHDPLPIQLVWGWVLWVAAAWGAYLLWQNRQALLAVIPLGILLTVTTFFTGVDNSILCLFLGITLVLQTTGSWRRRLHRWQTHNLDWASDLALDVGTTAVVLIGLIMTVSLLIPQISLTEIINKLKFQEQLAQSGQSINNMAASLGIERRIPLPTQSPRITMPSGMPRSHLLGAGPELTEKLVMLIKTNDPPQRPEQYGGAPPPAYYWLGGTFDLYTGAGWMSSPTTNTDLPPNQAQLAPEGPGRTLTQTVRPIQTFGSLLFTAGIPLQVNRPSQITYRSNKDWASTILEATEVYTAQSWLARASADDLRQAGTNYPEWITQRYLALPKSVPARVRSLALELTATAPTPYDRAIMLETYLRQFPYSLDISSIPSGYEATDYFLFDLKKGYCDYYATSMVVLARAAGLPARFAMGYAPSPYDYNTYQYVVREMEAHSWAQIYFPGYGWIDFEPTSGRSLINRAGESYTALPTLPANFNLNQAILANQSWWSTVPLWQLLLLVITAAGGVMALGTLIRWGLDERLARLPADRLIPLLQGRLERSAQWLGAPLPVGATTLEFQADLTRHLTRLAAQRPALQRISPAPVDMAQLVNTFVRLRYAPQRVTPADGRACLVAWRRLRWRLWGTIVVKKVRRIQ
jgi:transglutaminase-like putative cysteine protease